MRLSTAFMSVAVILTAFLGALGPHGLIALVVDMAGDRRA